MALLRRSYSASTGGFELPSFDEPGCIPESASATTDSLPSLRRMPYSQHLCCEDDDDDDEEDIEDSADICRLISYSRVLKPF